MKPKPVMLLVIWAALSSSLTAEEGKGQAWDMLSAQPDVVGAWQDMRFGMFNCWGPVSLTGQEIGWSRVRRAAASFASLKVRVRHPWTSTTTCTRNGSPISSMRGSGSRLPKMPG